MRQFALRAVTAWPLLAPCNDWPGVLKCWIISAIPGQFQPAKLGKNWDLLPAGPVRRRWRNSGDATLGRRQPTFNLTILEWIRITFVFTARLCSGFSATCIGASKIEAWSMSHKKDGLCW